MSEPPPLPGSDDPFELLGLPREGADAVRIKRAYAERIRVYRPDRSPEEFQRIRRAYEEAQRIVAWEVFDDVEDDDDDELVVAPRVRFRVLGSARPSEGDRPEPDALAWRELWTAVREGRADEARDMLRRAQLRAPREEWPYVARFLLSELEGSTTEETLAHFHDALEAGAPLSTCLSILSRQEVRAFARDERCSWPALRRAAEHGGGELAHEPLFEVRLSALLSSDGLETALAEVRDPSYLLAAGQDPRLCWCGLRVATAAAFRFPDLAEELFHNFAGVHPFTGPLEEHYLLRRGLAGAWQRWSSAHPDAEGLLRFLELVFSLPREDRGTLDPRPFIRRSPEVGLAALDTLVRKEPALYHHFLEAVEEGSVAGEASPPAERAGSSKAFVSTVEVLLAEHPFHSAQRWLGCLFVLIVLIGFGALGWWGLALLAALLVVFAIATSVLDRRLYRRVVRPRALAAIAWSGSEPIELVRAVSAAGRRAGNVAQYEKQLLSDEPLRLLARCLRVGGIPEVE